MSDLYLGLMSGTSLDGIDAALVDFGGPQMRLVAAQCTPFSAELRAELLALQAPGVQEMHRAALAGNALADAYAESVASLLATAKLPAQAVAAIGMHGQTVRHQPALGYTVQLGNASRLAELSGISVVSDFRSRDIAAGGQGAPLVPAFHHAVFGDALQHRLLINIGGIANVTDLPVAGVIRGWDTGPGNVLMDGWIARHRGQAYDAAGSWAASGHIVGELLQRLLAEPYFALPPPKSTGRDLFDMAWLDAQLAGAQHAAADVQATLLEFTAQSIARSCRQDNQICHAAYVCGGGAHNAVLIQRLSELLQAEVTSTEALGLDPDWVEACAFAWLARQCRLGLPGNLPAVTGARGLRVLGAIHQA